MKAVVIILSILLISLGIWGYFIKEHNNDLEADLKHLNNTFDTRVDKSINDAKQHVTDSLLNDFNSKPHDTIIKTEIQYRYETIYDTIVALPTSEQLEYITNELNRLY